MECGADKLGSLVVDYAQCLLTLFQVILFKGIVIKIVPSELVELIKVLYLKISSQKLFQLKSD